MIDALCRAAYELFVMETCLGARWTDTGELKVRTNRATYVGHRDTWRNTTVRGKRPSRSVAKQLRAVYELERGKKRKNRNEKKKLREVDS